MEHVNSPFGFVDQIILVVFMLMLFAGLAGGNPGMVLKPAFEIAGQIIMALISLLCALITMLFRVLLSGIMAGAQALAERVQTRSSRQIK